MTADAPTAPLAADGVDLLVDWCDHEAAKWAVMHWHYSRRMPLGKLAKVGAWENGRFVGAVVFGRGATPNIGRPFDVSQDVICELVRVALRAHRAPVSQITAAAVRLLRVQSPGLRLVVSFADSGAGHHGGIYQAMNWLYLGAKSEDNGAYRVNGVIVHPRSLHTKYGTGGQSIPWLRANVDPDATRIKTPPKHKYVLALDRAMRRRILPFCQDYPAPET